MFGKEIAQSTGDFFDQAFRGLPIDDTIDAKTRSYTLLFPFNDDSPAAESVLKNALSLQKSLSKLDRATEQVRNLLISADTSITFGPEILQYRPLPNSRCSHALILSVDPLEHSRMHLSCIPIFGEKYTTPNSSCIDTNSYGALRINEKILLNLVTQIPGDAIALLPLMAKAPCMSELAEFQRARKYLAASGIEALISPAQVTLEKKGVAAISFYEGNWDFAQTGAERESQLIKNFQDVLEKFANGIRSNPQIRKSHNDSYSRFARELLALETKLAIEFFSNQDKSKGLLASMFLSRDNSSERVQKLRVNEFADALKEVREEILKTNVAIPTLLSEFSRRIALTLAQHVTKDMVNQEYFSREKILISEGPIRITNKIHLAQDIDAAQEIAGVSFNNSAIQSSQLSHQLHAKNKTYQINIADQNTKFPSVSDLTALLLQASDTIQICQAESRPWLTPYQGFMFNPDLTKNECNSALFAISQMNAVIESAEQSWKSRQTNWSLKGPNLIQALEDRLTIQLQALESLELRSSIDNYRQAITEEIKQLRIKQNSGPTLEKITHLPQEAFQRAKLFHEHLIKSGIILPVYFVDNNGSRLNTLPIKVGDTLAEVFLRRMIADNSSSESLDRYSPAIIELAQIFWQDFSAYPEIFTPAALAIKAGMKLNDIFPEGYVTTLVADKNRVFEAAQLIGSQALGERIISAQARATLKVTGNYDSLNNSDDVSNAFSSIHSASDFLSKQSTLASHLKLNDIIATTRQLHDFTIRDRSHEHTDDSANISLFIARTGVKALTQLRTALLPLQSMHDKLYNKKIGSSRLLRSEIPKLLEDCAMHEKELARVSTTLKSVGITEILDLAFLPPKQLPESVDEHLTIAEASEFKELTPETAPLQSIDSNHNTQVNPGSLDNIDQSTEPQPNTSIMQLEYTQVDQAISDSSAPANSDLAEDANTLIDQEKDALLKQELEELWENGGMGEEFIKLEMAGSTLSETEFRDLYLRYKRYLGDQFIGIVFERIGIKCEPARLNDQVLELNADRAQELTPDYLKTLKPN
jgi:hypothetical protein